MLGKNLGDIDQRNLIWPVVKALQALGGEATAEQMYRKIIELEDFNKNLIHAPRKNEDNQYYESLGWARQRARNLGLIKYEKVRKIWFLTDEGKATKENDINDNAKRNSG